MLPLGLCVYFLSQLPDAADGHAVVTAYPWVPSLNLTLFSAYERNLPWWDIDWFAQLDYNYMSKRYLETDLDKNLLTDRTHLLGLRGGLRHPEMKWELTAWVKNVTEETFQAAGFDIPVLGGYAVVIGPPRTAGVTARVNF